MYKSNAVSMYSLLEDVTLAQSLFNVKALQKNATRADTVHRYYYWTQWLYLWLHSKAGAMHFPLYLHSDVHHHEALTTQAQLVNEAIHTYRCKSVAEIGCGMGYNTFWLAKNNPNMPFLGIDSSEKNLKFAKKKAKTIPNLTYTLGNWNAPFFSFSNMDICFAVESFCYTKNLFTTLTNVANSLSKNGHFMIFDAFSTPALFTQSNELKHAVELTAWSFAVNNWYNVEQVISTAEECGLKLVQKTDYTHAIAPNLARFQRDMQRICRQKPFEMVFKSGIVPISIQGHIIAGLLSMHTMQTEAHRYFFLHFQKK